MVDGGCVDMEDTNIGDGGVSDLDVAVCRVSGGVQCKLQERREGVVIRIHQLTTLYQFYYSVMSCLVSLG